MDGIGWGSALWKDLRYGARLLSLNPGFAAVAILSLALGIGANTAIFQLVNAIRLRSLPVQDPQGLAVVRLQDRSWASGNFSSRYSSLTNPQWEQIRDRQQGFSKISAWSPQRLNLANGGEARYGEVIWVSGEFFNVLGVQPYVGRLLGPEDDRRGCGATSAVISYSFWQRQYGGERDILGKKLTLEGHPFSIIGITPPEFFGVEVGRNYEVAIPICSEPVIIGEDTKLDVRRSWWLASIGRLKPGWTLAQATGQLETISPAVMKETLPPAYDADGVQHYLAYKLGAYPADSGFSQLRREYSTPLWMLLAIAGLVLVIACANLANLMLARASAREKEIAVRLAVGATRGRLIRQLLSESLLLAGMGTAFGALLARGLTTFLIAFLSTQSDPLFVNLGTDWRVLGFTAALAVTTCVLFGLAPAVRATGVAPGAVLKAAGRGVTAGRDRFGLRRALVVAQVALSLVLLVGALLFVRSLRNLTTLDAGFQRDGILELDVDFSSLKVTHDRRAAFNQELRERLAAIPGVISVADTTNVPVGGNTWNQLVIGDGADRKVKGVTNIARISPGYFKTIATPILMGRDFNGHDTASAPSVAIVNQSFVKKFFPAGSPIGQRFRLQEGVGEPEPYYEVVGVTKDAKYADLHDDFAPVMYLADLQFAQQGQGDQILIRSDAPLIDLMNEVKQSVAAVSPEIVIDFHVFRTTIENSLIRERLMATLSSFFGFLAALLATVGLYGVISYSVARRRNEIGIRMALGAGRTSIVRLIMGEAGILLAIGIVVGVGLALALGKTASTLLFGLKFYDTVTMGIAIVTLSVVAAAASYLPAFRASRVDPMMALRDE
jgi:predicted permease|nr:ABC transporter permease [Candidatus Acidoferrales bacterium]